MAPYPVSLRGAGGGLNVTLADKSEAGAARAGMAEGESVEVWESDTARPSGRGEELEQITPRRTGAGGGFGYRRQWSWAVYVRRKGARCRPWPVQRKRKAHGVSSEVRAAGAGFGRWRQLKLKRDPPPRCQGGSAPAQVGARSTEAKRRS
jgi:hypothetical protein